MRKVVSDLLELQELEITLQESSIVHKGDCPAEFQDVKAKVDQLRSGIPDQLLKRYDGHRRTGLGAVREIGGLCRGCHLNVPVGDLNRMKRSEIPWICPNCGRFLLLSGE